MSTTSFIQLFSDEAAKPDVAFISQLESSYMQTATSKQARLRLSNRQKLIIGLSIIGIIAVILGLVFFPTRDMSDPTTNSLVETVVDTSQQSIEPFTTDANNEPSTNTETQTNDAQTTANSNTTTPSASQSSTTQSATTPISQPVQGFTVSFWNLDLDSAVAPNIPANPANATTSTNTISYNWGTSSPYSGIFADGFVARFTKDATDMSGQYKVVYSSDNGLRMHINETVVFDFWNSASSSGTAYFNTDPASPTTSITIDYYEYDGPANVSVEITKVN